MSHPIPLRQRLLVTACATTRTTDLAARRLGAARFLPKLFVLRYANMGGLDRDAFAAQLSQVRSFQEARWCGYWDGLAGERLDAAQAKVRELAGGSGPVLRDAVDAGHAAATAELAALLAPATAILADHGPQTSHSYVEQRTAEHTGGAADADLVTAAIALDEIVKAITYFQVSAFPGGSTARMRAYAASRQLSDLLVAILAAGLDDATLEPFSIDAGGETVTGYAFLPATDQPSPTVLITNGLEGTVQELLIPNLRYRGAGLATYMMEMPGTYDYREPMSAASERIYDAVIDNIAQEPRVDDQRLAMVGVSFGGYWSTRMAATNRRLRCAVSCGAPTHHSFQPASSLGIPQVIVEALADVTGATNPISLTRGLRALSLRDRYASIPIPLLVINGDTDTLLSTQDSIDLAEGAPHGELKLYPDDDHCAMGHNQEWLDLSQQWLADHLVPSR